MKYSRGVSKKQTYVLAILVAVFVAYIGGFASGVKKYFSDKEANSISISSDASNIGNLKNCTIQRLETLPDSFSVVIGHAYGSKINFHSDDFIADNILKFIVENRNNIEKLVFTGDVFYVPSMYKWEKLFQEFGLIDVFVAPGNHDVGRPGYRDFFKASNFIRQDYPYEIKISGSIVILDDSVLSEWIVDGEVTRQIAESESQNIIVARHHVLIPELLNFANSPDTPVPLPPVEKFIKNFPPYKSVTWIMGDGGAFDRLPRVTCHKYRNHRFIVNGIGEIKGDVILLISNGTIYQYILE